ESWGRRGYSSACMPPLNAYQARSIVKQKIRRQGAPPRLVNVLFLRRLLPALYWLKPDEVPLCGPGSDQGSGVEAELTHNMLDVDAHGTVSDHQLPGDIPVSETLRNQGGDLGLARGQGSPCT